MIHLAARGPSTSRRVSPGVLLLVLGCLWGITAYVIYRVDPGVVGAEPDGSGRILYDSIGYMRYAREEFRLSDTWEPLRALVMDRSLEFNTFTNLLLYLQATVAGWLVPWSPWVGVLWINCAVLLWGVSSHLRLATRIGIPVSSSLVTMLLINPLVWGSALTLTKEIWGFAFLGAFALAAVDRAWSRLVLLGVLSAFAREIYALVALGILVATLFQWSRWRLLVVVAAALGIVESLISRGGITSFRTVRSIELDQTAAPLLAWMGDLQSIPLGHIVAFPVVVGINVVTPAVAPSQWSAGAEALYVHANTVSSVLFIVVGVVGLARLRRDRARDRWLAAASLPMFTYAVLVSTYPIVQHRYLVPMWGLLVLWALAGPRPSAGDVVVVEQTEVPRYAAHTGRGPGRHGSAAQHQDLRRWRESP